MKVLFAAAEMAPFAKTGGLGDVVGSLPIELRRRGVDARVVIPMYGFLHRENPEYRHLFQVKRPGGDGDVHLFYDEYQGVPVYFLKSWPYFGEEGGIYSTWDWDMPRFIYFAQMVMALTWELAQGVFDEGEAWWPDVLHVHDWHTGLLPFLLHLARFEPGWNDMASVMTLHNMAFQGPYASPWMIEQGLPNRDHWALGNQWQRDNLLAMGIAFADKINTVSPRHAIELHYPRFGEGLESVIWARHDDFVGILNGIDTRLYDPATDKAIAQNYSVANFREKRIQNKLALQSQLNLPLDPDIPLMGLISRLTEQKGLDFALPAIREVLAGQEAQFVGIGMGDPALENQMGSIGLQFSEQARTYLVHDNLLARQIYAGADLLLVPSRYEPCGLTQMIAMRYGSLPLVRETGGLADTVQNYDNHNADSGTGFTFLWEQPHAMAETLRWALGVYRHRRDAWTRMQERAMQQDWSWEGGVQQYIGLYERAISKKRAWHFQAWG